MSDSGSDSMIASGSRNEPNCTTSIEVHQQHRHAERDEDLREDLGLILVSPPWLMP